MQNSLLSLLIDNVSKIYNELKAAYEKMNGYLEGYEDSKD